MGRIFVSCSFFFSFFQGRQTDYLQRRLTVARILAGLKNEGHLIIQGIHRAVATKGKDHGNENVFLRSLAVFEVRCFLLSS